MNGRDVFGLVLVLASLAIAFAMIATSPTPTTSEEPTSEPSGEYAEPCDLEADRSCNEQIDVKGGQR